MNAICRHCKRHEANRPRGLCWSCYYNPAITVLYPSTSRFAARRGLVQRVPRCSIGSCSECRRKRTLADGICAECQEKLDDVVSVAALEAALEAEYAKSPLWAPSDLPSDSREYLHIVRLRERAGLPARHPGDRPPDLS